MQRNRAHLPDGRMVIALGSMYAKTFPQLGMFKLGPEDGLVPSWKILSVSECLVAIRCGAANAVSVGNWWRTEEYGLYARGFREGRQVKIGSRLAYVERGITYEFDVPDVKHPRRDKSLREADGVVVIPRKKLVAARKDEKKYRVSAATGFSEKDVRVEDVMRPDNWALPDARGYPARKKPANRATPGAMCSRLRGEDKFEEGSTGWHGSVALSELFVYLDAEWYQKAAVAAAGKKESILLPPDF